MFHPRTAYFFNKIMESLLNVLNNKFLILENAVKTCSDLYDTVKVTVDKNTAAAIKKLQTDNDKLSNQIKVLIQAKVNYVEEVSLKLKLRTVV